MSGIMSDFIVGVFEGIVLVALITYLVRWSRKNKSNSADHYDERQLLARGKGYKISFMTTVGLCLCYGIFAYGVTETYFPARMAILTIPFIGLLVYVVYCIMNDAYVQVGQKTQNWVALNSVVILANLVSFVSNVRRQPLYRNAVWNEGAFLNLAILIVFAVILITFQVKKAMDKKEAANEES